MATSRNIFHDLHHQTERTIARTRQATRELEDFLDTPAEAAGRLKKRRIAELRDERRPPNHRAH
jgi:hypothetical protein